jgi:hypothetical protein
MSRPGSQLETVHDPIRYTPRELERAYRVAEVLGRGRFVLTAPPVR